MAVALPLQRRFWSAFIKASDQKNVRTEGGGEVGGRVVVVFSATLPPSIARGIPAAHETEVVHAAGNFLYTTDGRRVQNVNIRFYSTAGVRM